MQRLKGCERPIANDEHEHRGALDNFMPCFEPEDVTVDVSRHNLCQSEAQKTVCTGSLAVLDLVFVGKIGSSLAADCVIDQIGTNSESDTEGAEKTDWCRAQGSQVETDDREKKSHLNKKRAPKV